MYNKFWSIYLIFILLVLWLALGCAHVYTPPERITIDVPIEIHLYESVADLQTACEVGKWKDTDCDRLLGAYKVGLHELHCVKWDFEVCGHELYHVLQREGSPKLNADGREHFKP